MFPVPSSVPSAPLPSGSSSHLRVCLLCSNCRAHPRDGPPDGPPLATSSEGPYSHDRRKIPALGSLPISGLGASLLDMPVGVDSEVFFSFFLNKEWEPVLTAGATTTEPQYIRVLTKATDPIDSH